MKNSTWLVLAVALVGSAASASDETVTGPYCKVEGTYWVRGRGRATRRLRVSYDRLTRRALAARTFEECSAAAQEVLGLIWEPNVHPSRAREIDGARLIFTDRVSGDLLTADIDEVDGMFVRGRKWRVELTIENQGCRYGDGCARLLVSDVARMLETLAPGQVEVARRVVASGKKDDAIRAHGKVSSRQQ